MTSVFDFLHIKGRTAGSSNELSFDVLDAARRQMDAQEKATKRGGRGFQGSHAASGGGALSSGPAAVKAAEEEVQRRKQRRRRRALRLRVVGVLCLTVVLCGTGFFCWRIYQHQMDFRGQVNDLLTSVIAIDESLASIDGLMTDPFDANEQQQRERAAAQIPDLQAQLSAVDARARGLAARTDDEGEALTLNEVAASIEARQQFLVACADAFELSTQVNLRMQEVDRLWAHVVDGDQQVREAASLANQATTEEATIQARDATQAAADSLADAGAAIAELQNQVPGADFTPQLDYLDTRSQALVQAVATSDALLQGDRAAATAANDQYNRLEKMAAEQAAALPAAPSGQMRDAFAAQMQQTLDAYDKARAYVTKTDADLRTLIARP